MTDTVFISYASADQPTADRLVAEIERRGIRCWISSRDIRAGEDYQSAIVAGLEASAVVLLLFSHHANASTEIPRELGLASKLKKMVIPARLEDIVPSGSFAYQITTAQFIDLFHDFESKVDDLCIRLAELLESSAEVRARIEREQQRRKKRRTFWHVALGSLIALVLAATLWLLRGTFEGLLKGKPNPASATVQVPAPPPVPVAQNNPASPPVHSHVQHSTFSESCTPNFNVGSCVGQFEYTQDTTLSGDLFVEGGIVVNAGVTVTTEGHSIIVSNAFVNHGILATGLELNGGPRTPPCASGYNGIASPDSLGGSGGGGSVGESGCGGAGGYGGATQAAGGKGGVSLNDNGHPGETPPAPQLTRGLIRDWWKSEIGNYLKGAGGGGGAGSGSDPGAPGGGGAYGLYLQARRIVAGSINASGAPGSAIGKAGCSGGGGGGVILIAYGDGGYVPGNFNVQGGTSQCSPASGRGASGGAGQVLTYHYATAPIQKFPTAAIISTRQNGSGGR